MRQQLSKAVNISVPRKVEKDNILLPDEIVPIALIVPESF